MREINISGVLIDSDTKSHNQYLDLWKTLETADAKYLDIDNDGVPLIMHPDFLEPDCHVANPYTRFDAPYMHEDIFFVEKYQFSKAIEQPNPHIPTAFATLAPWVFNRRDLLNALIDELCGSFLEQPSQQKLLLIRDSQFFNNLRIRVEKLRTSADSNLKAPAYWERLPIFVQTRTVTNFKVHAKFNGTHCDLEIPGAHLISHFEIFLDQ